MATNSPFNNGGGAYRDGASLGMQQHSALQQQQRLSPMQVRFVRILEMNQQETESAVERELDDNPALERIEEPAQQLSDENGTPYSETAEQMQRADYASADDIPFYRLSAASGREETVSPLLNAADDSASLYDYLEHQLNERDMSDSDRQVALYVIGNIDRNGYLQRTPQAMTDDLAFGPGIEVPPEQMQRVMDIVHSLDPAGTGAVSLQDSLLLQLRRLPSDTDTDDAIRIISECFDAFTMKHTHRIISKLRLSEQRVAKAIALILSLNPKPGSVIGTGHGDIAQPIVPDFVIEVSPESEITVSLPGRIPSLGIEAGFESAVRQMQHDARLRRSREAEFITARYNDARDFIEIMRLRQETLFSVMTAITNRQKDYILTGDEHTLRPLGLKDIAADTGFDISTVSRATAGKYAALPYGVKPLRFFFSASYSAGDGGEAVSARAIQAALRSLVEAEDKKHPLSDDRLCALLTDKGYEVSRRTVAKYRDRLGIPVARLRKNLGTL